jgi:hypothetical protein
MVKNLSDLLDDLENITSKFISQACSEELAREEIEPINHASSLEEIQSATGREETVTSAPASIRQRRIEPAMLASGAASSIFDTASISFEQVGIGVEDDILQTQQNTVTRIRDIIDANERHL